MTSAAGAEHELPGTQQAKRFRPRFHYELLSCGMQGHELFGTDVAELRLEDALVARDDGERTRWHRCVRCDSWLPLPAPAEPTREHLPPRSELELPLRGKALRDKFVLRVIAVDRALHFLILTLLAVAVFLFATNEVKLRGPFYKVLADVQGGLGGPQQNNQHGFFHSLDRLFSVNSGTLQKIGFVIVAYALLEGTEAIGLWFQKRWAEYLTFIATAVLVPAEVYELTHRLSPLKIITLIINLAVVVYLLFAKRLFGLRGGGAAEQAERERDVGWEALERTAPGAGRPVAAAAS